jgi:hypothetical protein
VKNWKFPDFSTNIKAAILGVNLRIIPGPLYESGRRVGMRGEGLIGARRTSAQLGFSLPYSAHWHTYGSLGNVRIHSPWGRKLQRLSKHWKILIPLGEVIQKADTKYAQPWLQGLFNYLYIHLFLSHCASLILSLCQSYFYFSLLIFLSALLSFSI